MRLKRFFAAAVSVSLAIGALLIPEFLIFGGSYNVAAAAEHDIADNDTELRDDENVSGGEHNQPVKQEISADLSAVSEVNNGLSVPKSLADITDKTSFCYQNCPTIGDIKALCFMVDFPDVRNQNEKLTAETMKGVLNGTSSELVENSNDPRSNVSGYYSTSSYGKMNIDFDLYGWYTFENDREYCGAELGVQGMLNEVMSVYDHEIDFSEYDANNDGMIDLVYLMYAGPNDGANGFWWSYVANGSIEKYDQKNVSKFAFINLESSTLNDDLAAVEHFSAVERDCGTIIHETGHLLGLADYYDTTGGHGAIGYFDIMDKIRGDHNIFSKMMLGWVEPVFITQDTAFNLNCVSDEDAKAYIIAPEFENGVFSEYFIVEFYKNIDNNRDSVACPNGAVRIYHVDATLGRDLNAFKYNNSDSEHPLINIVESDGEYATLKYEDLSYTKDYYAAGMTFGTNTSPSTEFYEGEFTGINITVNSISNDSANVTVTFNNVDNEAPEMTSYVMPNAFGRVTNISGTNIYFSSNIYEGNNFGKISYAPTVSPNDKTYLIKCYIENHPQSKNYGLNSIFIMDSSELTENTDYILTIPAGAVVDSSGNSNDEIVIKFTSCGGTCDYVKVDCPDYAGKPDIDLPSVYDSIINSKDFYSKKYTVNIVDEKYGYAVAYYYQSGIIERGETADYIASTLSGTNTVMLSPVHDVQVLCSKIAKNGLPLIDVDGGYIGISFAIGSILLDDDGMLLIYDIKDYTKPGRYQIRDERFIVRLNKDLEVMWDCLVPFSPQTAFCGDGKVYVGCSDGIYAFDDNAAEPIFKKDEVRFSDIFDVDKVNQVINNSGKTAAQIKNQLVEDNADITIYALDGSIISDSAVVDEALVEIHLPNSAYNHYYHYTGKPILSGKIEASAEITSDTEIKLMDNKGVTFTAEITDGTYSFKENIPDGEYTLNVTKSKHCPRQSSVTISKSKPVELDVELHLYGDANFDGAIDAKDATQILRYCSGLSSAFGDEDEYRLQVANVRGNGGLAPQDATQILKNASLQSSIFDTLA